MKSDTNPDRYIDAAVESMQALGSETLLTQTFEATQNRIIQELLTKFRSNELTNEHLWAGIGAINEFDKLHARLDRTIRQGQKLVPETRRN